MLRQQKDAPGMVRLRIQNGYYKESSTMKCRKSNCNLKSNNMEEKEDSHDKEMSLRYDFEQKYNTEGNK